MSHNLGNGGTFGIDSLVKVTDPKTLQTGSSFYAITDYKGSIELSPSDAALAAILLLQNVFDRNLFPPLKNRKQIDVELLKSIIKIFTEKGLIREQAV